MARLGNHEIAETWQDKKSKTTMYSCHEGRPRAPDNRAARRRGKGALPQH